VKLLVGLGNPGVEYQHTPHNLGFLVIDRIASQCDVAVSNRHCKALTARARIGNEEVLLAKPQTYMNLSGMSVLELVRKYETDPQKDLLLIYDELDFPFGTVRIKERGTSAGHNGAQSVMDALASKEILRVRMGVAPDFPIKDGMSYLLSPFKKSQLAQVDELIDLGVNAVHAILNDGRSAAMNRFNRRVKPEGPERP
jgi:PTH1 family peptidyl-tRNA hydrolase